MQRGAFAAVPFEVWSRIFMVAYESYNTSSLPLPCDKLDPDLRKSYMAQQKWIHSLSGVCIGWRNILTRTSAIWSSLSMDVTPTNITACVRAIALHRRRSGGRLSVGLCFCSFSGSQEGARMLPAPTSTFEEMESKLFSRRTRKKLVALVLRHAPEAWLVYMSSRGRFPRLNTFIAESLIRVPLGPVYPFNRGNNPPTQSPFPRLTQLSLKEVPSHIFVSQAAVSPTLTDVEYHGGSDYVSSLAQSWSLLQDFSVALPAPVILSRVERFSWRVSASETLLQHIQLNPPAWLNFTFKETSSSGFSAAALEVVCNILQSSQNSQPTPPYVTLSDLSSLADPNRDLRQLLHAMRSVEILEVQKWSGSLLVELANLMSMSDSMGVVYLPQLRRIRFDLFSVQSPPLTRAIMDKLSQVIEVRPTQTHGNQDGFGLAIVCRPIADSVLNAMLCARLEEMKLDNPLVTVEWIC